MGLIQCNIHLLGNTELPSGYIQKIKTLGDLYQIILLKINLIAFLILIHFFALVFVESYHQWFSGVRGVWKKEARQLP